MCITHLFFFSLLQALSKQHNRNHVFCSVSLARVFEHLNKISYVVFEICQGVKLCSLNFLAVYISYNSSFVFRITFKLALLIENLVFVFKRKKILPFFHQFQIIRTIIQEFTVDMLKLNMKMVKNKNIDHRFV